MVIYLKFDFKEVCSKVLEDILNAQDINYKVIAFGEVELLDTLTSEQRERLLVALSDCNISIVENQKSILVEKIKDTIIDMIFNDDTQVTVKTSTYLSNALGHSYGYLSNLFAEVTYTSIENFIILQKIEYTKHLIINENLSLTEIAFKLEYSSVAHLSTQFKNATGITPSAFQRIISKRRELAQQNTE